MMSSLYYLNVQLIRRIVSDDGLTFISSTSDKSDEVCHKV